MRSAVRPLLNETRAPGAPTAVWRDWVLLAVVVLAGVVEAALTVEISWLPVALVVSVLPSVTVLRRRTQPLAMIAIGFGAVAFVSILISLGVPPSISLYSNLYVFVLSYAVFRWGSGREAMAAFAIMVTVHAVSELVSFTGTTDLVVGAALYLVAAATGASVRYRTSSQLREAEKAQMFERELLARELHDTVAHYVTAIAVQAESGLARAESGQDGSVETLESIKQAASSALMEMRSLVGVLRQGEEPELAPQHGLADLETLAGTSGHLPVEIDVADDLGIIGPSISAAIYRIAQESITNTIRHSPRATRIRISVTGDDQQVTIVVSDNGAATRRDPGSPGYGLVGMTERVTLLGGTLEAGPSSDRGWTVTATLPRARTER